MALALMFEKLLYIAFSFPTAIFTVFLGVMVVLWVITLCGLLDLDFINLENANAEAVAGLLLHWGLVDVPVTIILTILSVVSWTICYYAVFFLFDFIPGGLLSVIAGIGVIIVSFWLGIKITAFLIKPLKPLFKKVGTTIEKTVLGKVAIVRSSKVTETFGEAVIYDLGADLLLKIWADEPNLLKKGDKVVPIEYDAVKGVYFVVSESKFKN